jgi:hypothetical protein
MLVGLTVTGLGCASCSACPSHKQLACASMRGFGDATTTKLIPSNYQAREMIGAATNLLSGMYKILDLGLYDTWFMDKVAAKDTLDAFQREFATIYDKLPANAEPVAAYLWPLIQSSTQRLKKLAVYLENDKKVNGGFPSFAELYDGFKATLAFGMSIPEKAFNAIFPDTWSMGTKIAIATGGVLAATILAKHFKVF